MSGCGTSTGLRRPATPVVRASIPGPLRAAWEAHAVALDDVQRWLLHPDPRAAHRAVVVPRVCQGSAPLHPDGTAVADALAWAALRHLSVSPDHVACGVDPSGAVDAALKDWGARAHQFDGPAPETLLARWNSWPNWEAAAFPAAHGLVVATRAADTPAAAQAAVFAIAAAEGAVQAGRCSVGADGVVVDGLSWRTARVRAWAPLRDVSFPDPDTTLAGIAAELQRLVDSPRDGGVLLVAPRDAAEALCAATDPIVWTPYDDAVALALPTGWVATVTQHSGPRLFEAVLLAPATARQPVLALAPRLLAHTGRAGEEMRLLLACQNAPDLLLAAALREQLLAGEATSATLDDAVAALELTTRDAVADRLAGPDGGLMATFWMVSVLGINRGNAGAIASWLATR